VVSIDVSSGQCPDYLAVTLRGELDATQAALVKRALLAAAVFGSQVIVDLAQLTRIDCSGVSAPASARPEARETGGDLLFAAAPQPVTRLLFLTGRTGLLPVFASANGAANGPPANPAAVRLPQEQPVGAINSANGETSSAQARYLATGRAYAEGRLL
jgi:anti-anti-sigma factor